MFPLEAAYSSCGGSFGVEALARGRALAIGSSLMALTDCLHWSACFFWVGAL